MTLSAHINRGLRSGRSKQLTPVRHGALTVTVTRCAPAPLHSLFKSEDWTFLKVDAVLHNQSDRPMRIPRGESVILADGVGYAYSDVRRVVKVGTIAAGATKSVRYLFRVPDGSGIGKLIIQDSNRQTLASTGFIDIKVPPPPSP